MRAFIKRTGAFGDVVMTTPVVRALHSSGYTDITVATAYPGVFAYSPYVRVTVPAAAVPEGVFDRVVDLDLAHERAPRVHIVASHMATAGVKTDVAFWQPQIFQPPGDAVCKRGSAYVVVHGMGPGWRNKQRDPVFWRAVHAGIRTLGYATISVGSPADNGDGDVDLRGRQTVQNLAKIIAGASCFVGTASGPMCVAGATDTPIVGLFTSAQGAYLLPYREGVLGLNCIGLEPALPCVGCLYDESAPATFVGCRRGDYACAEGPEAVPAERVVDAVKSLTC